MPPEVIPIQAPDGLGRDVVPFLESLGLVAWTPPCSSSCYELILSNPFDYYLRRRLRIINLLSWSKALSRGSWLHKAYQLDPFQPTSIASVSHFSPAYQSTLDRRLEELSQTCANCGITGDARTLILDREVKDASCSWAWYHASMAIKIGDSHPSLREFLSNRQLKLLAREIGLRYNHPSFPKMPLLGHLDGLYYNQDSNRLWILDLKTCDCDPSIRLSTCPIEFQTQHYIFLCMMLLPQLIRRFSLPTDVQVGGMIHAAIQKPTIELGLNDRDYREVPFTPKTGKNKGITRIEKEYFGEPTLANYLVRCAHWYRSTGDYTHLAADRLKEPPVNLSHTKFFLLDSPTGEEYHERLRFVYEHATREAFPGNYLRSASALRQRGKMSDLADFSLCPVRDWPHILKKNNFTVRLAGEEGIPDGIEEAQAQQEEVVDPA